MSPQTSQAPQSPGTDGTDGTNGPDGTELAPPRPATPGDVAEIVRLKAVLMETGWPFPVSVSQDDEWQARCTEVARRLVDHPDHGWFVVDAPGRPGALAACVSVNVSHHLPGPRGTGITAYVGDMVTDEGYRGRGLGQQLLDAALDWARANGAGRVELYSTESGRALYERAGFADEPNPFTHLTRSLD